MRGDYRLASWIVLAVFGFVVTVLSLAVLLVVTASTS
jgi:hypothetical protein